MPTLEATEHSAPAAADDFHALEERILRAVEMLKHERELRAAAEERAARLSEDAGETAARVTELEKELSTLHGERDAVRQRVERLLRQLDEVSA